MRKTAIIDVNEQNVFAFATFSRPTIAKIFQWARFNYYEFSKKKKAKWKNHIFISRRLINLNRSNAVHVDQKEKS